MSLFSNDTGDCCPSCGSTNIDQASNWGESNKKYKCCSCGKFFDNRVSACDVGETEED